MRRFLGILFVGLVVAMTSVSTASAGESTDQAALQTNVAEKAPQGERLASNDSGFAPEGFVRDVYNLVNGLSHPIDGSTSFTIRAGKSLHIGLSF
jgi:hypothetical protein